MGHGTGTDALMKHGKSSSRLVLHWAQGPCVDIGEGATVWLCP